MSSEIEFEMFLVHDKSNSFKTFINLTFQIFLTGVEAGELERAMDGKKGRA